MKAHDLALERLLKTYGGDADSRADFAEIADLRDDCIYTLINAKASSMVGVIAKVDSPGAHSFHSRQHRRRRCRALWPRLSSPAPCPLHVILFAWGGKRSTSERLFPLQPQPAGSRRRVLHFPAMKLPFSAGFFG